MNDPFNHHDLGTALGAQLLEEFRRYECAIAALAAALPPQLVDTFTEHAIDELLVDYARSTRSPEAPKVHAALGRRLREGVKRMLNQLDGGPID
jgi:hypothetical protein